MGVRVAVAAGGARETNVCPCQRVPENDAVPENRALENRALENRARVCPLCDGMGMRLVNAKAAVRVAEPCECQHERKVQLLLQRAAIPLRYADCSFENFHYERSDSAMARTVGVARTFADIYPASKEGVGLLFTGPIGTGKTHLATAVLRKLVLEKGVRGLFYDYQELLKQITNSYSATAKTTESEVLRPVFQAEILLLDELGGYRTTEWASDTVANILNTRYNSRRVTIITTNFGVDAMGEAVRETRSDIAGAAFGSAARAIRQDTLADRIGERMQSRLKQMCVTVKMTGPDYRDRDRATLQ
jgi:DNA replication protein DnaC